MRKELEGLRLINGGKNAELVWFHSLQEAPAGSSDAGTAAELVSETRAGREAVAKGPQMI